MADVIAYNGSDKWKQKATELLNQGGGGSGLVDDVKVNGTSVVDANKVAQIDLTPYAESADLATVATSGSYTDLSNKPTIPAAQVQSDWLEADTSAKSYIQNKPTIPSAQVNSDWNASSGVAEILNKPTLATVATSGSYNDLSNKPTIPSTASDVGAISTTEKGANSGVATLDSSGKVPSSQLDLSGKQDTLTAGSNITITNNVISASGTDNTKVPLRTSEGIATWTGASGSYFKLATITVNQTHVGGAIVFEISGTEERFTWLSVTFYDTADTDPGLTFEVNQYRHWYIKKVSAGVWDIYGWYNSVNGSNGSIVCHRLMGSRVDNGVTITFSMQTVSSLPSGTFTPNYGWVVHQASFAENANACNNHTLGVDVPSDAVFTDTKDTAGASNTSSKIYLIGATSQGTNPQTYSHDTAYVGTDGCLYSNSTKVLTAHQDISGKVSTSGDTMTGNLTINNAQVIVKENDITSGSNPSSDVWGKGFRVNDSTGANIAHTRAIKYTSGKQGIQVEAQRAISGTNYYNSLNMLIDTAGAKTIEVSDAAAWRSAIGAVNKAGDTMSGNLTVSRSGEALIQTKNTQWTLTTASNNGISANTSAGAFYHLGNDNTMIGRTNCYGGSDGAVSIVLQVYNKKTNGSSVNNAITAIIKKDGSQTYAVSNATNFRSAIGAAASSSRAYKENIEEMPEEEARKILGIEVCSYDYKEGFGEKGQFGVIAEDVLDKIPYAVNIPENYNEQNVRPEEGTTQELITIDYWKFIPHLIKTVQMQQREIEELKAEIKAIKEGH